MRVLVTGGRDYREERIVFMVLDRIDWEHGIDPLIHGAATGADAHADAWALHMGITVMPFPAEWKRLGKPAGIIRNQQMLVEGRPELVVAFPGGPGTADMVRRARAAGLPVLNGADPDLAEPI